MASSMFENKLVAILNKNIETGVALNALGHMSLGLGADIGREMLRLDTYEDADMNKYPDISQIPFIILRAKPNEIRKTVEEARKLDLKYTVFLDTMTRGTYLEQLERTKNSKIETLIFYGCVLFGPWDVVTEITKKFSLWK